MLHPSTPEPGQPEEPQSSSSVPTETVETASIEPKQASASSDCVEDCCRDIETCKVAQLIIDKKQSARSFGQRMVQK